MMWSSPMGVIGITSIIIVTIQIIRVVIPWIYHNFIAPSVCPKFKFKQMGEWALITGATEGIGKAYANALAKEGLNLVLVSRNQVKLETLAQDLDNKYKIETKLIEIDFTGGPEIYEKIEKEILGLEIGILVNNVGISYSHPDYFLTIANRDKLVNDIVTCNILSVTNMCRICMPLMVERKRGLIINLSSMAARIPNPMLSVYSASKAFVDKFTEDLQTEYAAYGIIMQSVLPGFVATNMSKIKRSTWMAPSADLYVKSTLATVGKVKRTTGYYPHAIMKLVINTMESLFPDTTNKIVLSQMENIRSRALRRKIIES